MNRLHRLLWIPTLLVVGACSHDESPAPLAPQEERIPIALNVQSVNGMQNASRTMIDNLDDLKTACTPTYEGGEGKGIGIWADYDIDESGNTVTYNIFKNITLVHSASEGDNPHSNWNYRGDEAFWVPGGKYTFTAYYPQEETKDYIVSSSNATTFIIDYNTNSLQCDLMVASNEVNTLEQGWNQNDPVQLKFYHTMAAVKIQCKFVEGYDYEDKLTSCWLQNTEKKDFTTVGMMVYGDKENLDNIQWFENFQPSATQKIYYWKNSGVAFTDKILAQAYTSTETIQGNAFAQNDGWVYIVPQKSDGTTRICFTTDNGGNTVYSIAIPKKTGTGTNEDEFLPGYRYTYTISISKTNLNLTLSIADWNMRESSFDITF